MPKKKVPTTASTEEYAKAVRMLFESFLKVGFTTEQAFQLTLLTLQRG